MYSAIFILLAWFVVTLVIARGTNIPSPLLPAIAFAPALSILYIVYFISIFLFSPETFLTLSSLVAFGLTGLLLSQHGRAVQIAKSFANFLGFIDTDDRFVVHGLNNSLKAIKVIAILRKIITTLAIFSLIISSFLTPSPRNFDSNVYNIARIPAMIINSSPLVRDTGSVRQAVYSMAHDLLFYPDIIHNNLRGLPLVSVLEFILLLGALLQLAKLCVSELNIPESYRKLASEISMLVTACMLIASDQQVMQALSTKNDMVIWALFAVSFFVTLSCFKYHSILTSSELLAISLLVFIYSVSAKPYGFIVVFPLIFACALSILTQQTSLFNFQRKLIDSGAVPSRSTSFGLDLSWSMRWPFKLCVIIASLLLIIIVTHYKFVQLHYHGSALADVTTMWANNTSDLGVRSRIMLLNFVRIIVSFFAYPYSTLLKPNARSFDDYLLGLGPISDLLTQNNFGVVKGFAFVISRKASEDHSLTSPLFHFVLFAIVLVNIFFLLSKPRQILSLGHFVKVSLLRIPSMWVIVCTSMFSILSVFFFILYQNWIFKYFGFGYVAIMPVLSALFTQICLMHIVDSHQVRLRLIPLALSGLLAIFISLGLFYSHIPGYIRSSALNALSLNINTAEFRNNQNPLTYYNFYLNSNGISNAQGNELLAKLNSDPTDHRLICFNEDTPSLLPLLAVSSNPSSRRSAKLLSNSSQLCNKDLSVDAPTPDKRNPDSRKHEQKKEEVIFLP
jgi:hypothetical protein